MGKKRVAKVKLTFYLTVPVEKFDDFNYNCYRGVRVSSTGTKVN